MILAKEMPIEFLGAVPIHVGIGLEVIMAIVLGGLVGYDREKKLKTAGLKTNMLICLGATLYTSIGILIATSAGGTADPNRIAAQIVSGIGFLGAGAIIQSRGNVIGMTTAATIWVMAAIGFTIGAGFPFSAFFFSATVLLILKMINPFYQMMERQSDFQFFQLEVLSLGSVERTVRGIVLNENVEIEEVHEDLFEEKKKKVLLQIYMMAHHRQMQRISGDIKHILKVEKVAFHLVSDQIRNRMHIVRNQDTG